MSPIRPRYYRLLSVLVPISLSLGCGIEQGSEKKSGFPTLQGAYLGQTPPDTTPELFAPGFVSTGMYERDIAMTPDGKELYFTVTTTGFSYAAIVVTREIDGRWTKPEIAPFSGHPGEKDIEPCISPDGMRFFFHSTRPVKSQSETAGEDIWVMDRLDDGWGAPYNLGSPVNTDRGEYFPSVTRDGTLYFTRENTKNQRSAIYRSRFVDGRYQEPERLPVEVNSTGTQFNAFIAPDERYLIVCVFGRDDSFGRTDYYVCFHTADDGWTEPINLGDRINTAGGVEYSPYLSPDGRYFFFMSSRSREASDTRPDRLTYADLTHEHDEPQNGNPDIYWVDASFIEELQPE